MKSKKAPVTLQSLAKLIDQKFSLVDKRFDAMSTSIIGIYSEIDGVKQQIVGLDFKVSDLEKKMDQNFEIVFEGLTNLGTILDLDHEKRIKRLETKVFAN